MTDQSLSEPQSLPVCPRCHLTLRHSDDPRCFFCGVCLDPEYAANPIPWDNRSQLGFFKAFFSTIASVLFSPGKFFNRMRAKGGFWSPLFFYLIVGTVTSWVTLACQYLFHIPDLPLLAAPRDWISPDSLPILAILQPVFLIGGLFVTNAFLHFGLVLVKNPKRNFDASLLVLCYSAAACIWTLIPVWGNIVAIVWGNIVLTIGLSRAHNISIYRAILAVLLPPFMALGLCLSFGLLIGALSRPAL